MLARRPFGSDDELRRAAHEVWTSLGPEDWKEAFSHHPKIGERNLNQARFAATRALSEREQAGVRDAGEDVLAQLVSANREYESRFGYIFIVCASGKSAAEMLALLRARLPNSPEKEIQIAAAEQEKIMALRLEQLSTG